MFVSFGSRLRSLSGVRFGFRLHGWSAAFMLLVYGSFYLLWFSMLAMAWMVYGSCWLVWQFCVWVIYKPCVALIRWIKKKIAEKPEA